MSTNLVAREAIVAAKERDHGPTGRNFALVAGGCLLARYHHRSAPACQVLCYPVLDFGQDTNSAQQFNGVFHSIKPGWSTDQYLAGQPVTQHAAPLRAASLAGPPPALVIAAGRDPLRDDARAYAIRLDADGVNVTSVEYAGTMHAFLNFCGVLSAGDHDRTDRCRTRTQIQRAVHPGCPADQQDPNRMTG